MNYFVIRLSFGEVDIDTVSKEELKKRLKNGPEDESYYGEDCEILTEIPKETDWTQTYENAIIIIKGDLVVPIPKKVVVEFDI